MGYGDSTVARPSKGAHVGADCGPYPQAAAAQAGSQCGAGPGPVGPKRVLGNFSGVVLPGAQGQVAIQTQVPVIMRCLTTTELAAPFFRVNTINVGTVNHLVGGTVPGDSFLPIQRCSNLVDGLPLVPGMTLAIIFINISGSPLVVEFGVDAELMCP